MSLSKLLSRDKIDKIIINLQYGLLVIADNLPLVEHRLIELLDAIFTPRVILNQLMIATCIHAGLISFQSIGAVAQYFIDTLSVKGRRKRVIQSNMDKSESFAEWQHQAELLDNMMGLTIWRAQDDSPLYDSRVLKKRIFDIRTMVHRHDIFGLIFRLRGGLARDQYGMQHEGLFSKAAAGTKILVEDYHATVAAALNYVCDEDTDLDEIPTDVKLAFFNETRHSFGRTALLLSGGAYLGFYHIGLVQVLMDEGLLPRVISGASAGSLIAAILATHTDDELRALFISGNFRKDFFQSALKTSNSLAARIVLSLPQNLRWLGAGAMSVLFFSPSYMLKMDVEHFKTEAFDRTGRIVNITVAPGNNHDPPRLLNYLTAPHVCIWSAAVASCAIPGVFDSVPLIVKEPDGQFYTENEWTRRGYMARGEEEFPNAPSDLSYSDGSVEKDLPMEQLSELFNVNHFVISQVNSQQTVLSNFSMRSSMWNHPVYTIPVGILHFLKDHMRDWLRSLIDMTIYRTCTPFWRPGRGIAQLLTQEYEGRPVDITINPWRGHISQFGSVFKLIKNPNEEEYRDLVAASQRNTYPHIPRIKSHCLVEQTLDQCVQRLRLRIISESVSTSQNGRQSQLSYRGRVTSSVKASEKIDRTPSFYTTKSIINLSGLGVADPHPLAVAASYDSSSRGSLKLRSGRDSGLFGSGNLGSGHFGSSNNLSHFGLSYVNCLAIDTDPLSPRGTVARQESRSDFHFIDDNPLENNEPVVQNRIPLLNDSPDRVDPDAENDGAPELIAAGTREEQDLEPGGANSDEGKCREGGGERLSPSEGTRIFKTTSMANFYYSHSNNRTASMAHDRRVSSADTDR